MTYSIKNIRFLGVLLCLTALQVSATASTLTENSGSKYTIKTIAGQRVKVLKSREDKKSHKSHKKSSRNEKVSDATVEALQQQMMYEKFRLGQKGAGCTRATKQPQIMAEENFLEEML